MAAALTLAQTFTIRAPAQELDPTLAAGALDGDQFCPVGRKTERNALIRRPAFAPATYGRIRFHHRATQEYLTASWFDRLLQAGVSKSEVWPIFFAERYGVKTVVPSMRAAAAWLALKHPDFRDEVISREPLLFIQNDDPGSLPLPAKKRLLAVYADRHAAGEIAKTTWIIAPSGCSPNPNWPMPSGKLGTSIAAKIFVATSCAWSRKPKSPPAATWRARHSRTRTPTTIRASARWRPCKPATTMPPSRRRPPPSSPIQPPARSAWLPSSVAYCFQRICRLANCCRSSRALARCAAMQSRVFPSTSNTCTRLAQMSPQGTNLSRGSPSSHCGPFVQDYQRISRRYKKIAKSLEPIARMAMVALPAGQPPKPRAGADLIAVERADRMESREDEVKLSVPACALMCTSPRPCFGRTSRKFAHWIATVQHVCGRSISAGTPYGT